MTSKIYPGHSMFFSNRGNHDWRANNKRPMFSDHYTALDGTKAFTDYFLNTYAPGVEVSHSDGRVTISFPDDIKHPLFKMTVKSS